MSLSAAYKQFRGRRSFLICLSLFIAIWVSAHFLTGFDDGFGALNLILSAEASLSMAVFMALQAQVDGIATKADDFQRRQLEYLLELMEGQQAMLRDAFRREQDDGDGPDARRAEQ